MISPRELFGRIYYSITKDDKYYKPVSDRVSDETKAFFGWLTGLDSVLKKNSELEDL